MNRKWLLLAIAFTPVQALAVDCQITSNPVLDFGTTDPFQGGNLESTTNVSWRCSRRFLELNVDNTLCLFLGADSDGSIQPRYLKPAGGGMPDVPFNVYSDEAHTTPLLPSNNGIAIDVRLPLGNRNANGTIPLYGQVPGPLPATTRAKQHETLLSNSRIFIRTGGTGQSCAVAAGTPTDTYSVRTRLNIDDQCQVSATDLNFGAHGALQNAITGQSAVTVRCTNTTAFTVGLNNGLHADGSGNRRMLSAGHYVPYELFQNSGRTLTWDNTGNRKAGTGAGTSTGILMNVYGRVPAAPTAPPGAYSDTITVDVIF